MSDFQLFEEFLKLVAEDQEALKIQEKAEQYAYRGERIRELTLRLCAVGAIAVPPKQNR